MNLFSDMPILLLRQKPAKSSFFWKMRSDFPEFSAGKPDTIKFNVANHQ